MSRANRRAAAVTPAAAHPARASRGPSEALGERTGGQIAWRPCLAGLVAGEALLLLLSNGGLALANAAFGASNGQQADGSIVGVSTFLAVLFGGYLAARLAERFGLFQGVVVGAGFIAVGAVYQFGFEASVVHGSLASGSRTLVDLGPMSMGNLLSGDLLALVGGSIGGLLARKR